MKQTSLAETCLTELFRPRCDDAARAPLHFTTNQRMPHAIEAVPMPWKRYMNFKRDLQEGRCNERDVRLRDNNHRTGLAEMSRSVPCSPSQGETEHSLEWQVSSSLRRRMDGASLRWQQLGDVWERKRTFGTGRVRTGYAGRRPERHAVASSCSRARRHLIWICVVCKSLPLPS